MTIFLDDVRYLTTTEVDIMISLAKRKGLKGWLCKGPNKTLTCMLCENVSYHTLGEILRHAKEVHLIKLITFI